MHTHTAFNYVKHFADREEGASSVEWVVIVTMLAGFAYGTGMLMSNNTAVLTEGIASYIGSINFES